MSEAEGMVQVSFKLTVEEYRVWKSRLFAVGLTAQDAMRGLAVSFSEKEPVTLKDGVRVVVGFVRLNGAEDVKGRRGLPACEALDIRQLQFAEK